MPKLSSKDTHDRDGPERDAALAQNRQNNSSILDLEPPVGGIIGSTVVAVLREYVIFLVWLHLFPIVS